MSRAIFPAGVDEIGDPAKVRRLLALLGAVPDKVDAGGGLLVWVRDLLQLRAPIVQEQQEAVTAHFAVEIVSRGRALWEQADAVGQAPAHQLLIADSTFVAMSGQDVYLDLRSGLTTRNITRLPLELVSYNLTALFYCRVDELKRKRRHADQAQ